jgi:hypothetical protein
VLKPDGKRPFGRHRRRWENNIRMDLHEVGYGISAGSSWFRIETAGEHL